MESTLKVDKQSEKLEFTQQVSDENKEEMKKHDYNKDIIDK